MIEVNGIILVLSCHKHLNTRLKTFKFPKDSYAGWKVIYVVGDLFIDGDYKLDGDMLTIKCEDSYIHLLKKLVLSLKYIYQIFDIRDGVLRSGDDLYFNEEALENFLKLPKRHNNVDIDCMGRLLYGNAITPGSISEDILLSATDENFMIDYYKNHPEDFDNPLHNIKDIDILKYSRRPFMGNGLSGVLFYISNKGCKVLINHLESINFDIFYFDEYTQSYPYFIEDCGVTYILYHNKITMMHSSNIYVDAPGFLPSNDNKTVFKNYQNVIAIHTNYLR
jgi:hypothetical protein